jgi:hypothetical protein
MEMRIMKKIFNFLTSRMFIVFALIGVRRG